MNQNSPQAFVQFRFQNSLRRYENPPRKRVKMSQEKCSHCQRQHCHLTSKQRINLYCESRRKYQLFSRQKMSSYSKHLQGRKDIQRKQISEFVDDTNVNGLEEMPNFWQKIEIKGQDSQIFENYQIFKSQVSSKLNEQKKYLEEQVKTEMENQKKDIFFSIDLQIEEVQNLKNKLQKQLQKFDFTELWSENQGEDPKFKIRIEEEKLYFCSSDEEKESSEEFVLKIGLQQSREDTENQEIGLEKEGLGKMGENIYLKEDIIFNGGRIKLEGGKCLSLSTRILKRAIENFSMKEVKMKYPQLQNHVIEQISKIIINDKI